MTKDICFVKKKLKQLSVRLCVVITMSLLISNDIEAQTPFLDYTSLKTHSEIISILNNLSNKYDPVAIADEDQDVYMTFFKYRLMLGSLAPTFKEMHDKLISENEKMLELNIDCSLYNLVKYFLGNNYTIDNLNKEILEKYLMDVYNINRIAKGFCNRTRPWRHYLYVYNTKRYSSDYDQYGQMFYGREMWKEELESYYNKENYSFPSGHSTVCYAFAFIMSKIYPENSSKYLLKADSMAWSRVFLGFHHMSDVRASYDLAKQIAEMVIPKINTSYSKSWKVECDEFNHQPLQVSDNFKMVAGTIKDFTCKRCQTIVDVDIIDESTIPKEKRRLIYFTYKCKNCKNGQGQPMAGFPDRTFLPR
ncbi:MAG: phosphatase PAP2 family protein [Prevotella sp.]|nr:phosphatase PAP2 family protein [Prevotella sp.]